MVSWLLSWITMFLVWLSADPNALMLEDAKAAAAVAAAKAAVVEVPRRRRDEEVPEKQPDIAKPVVPVCPDGKCPIR